MPPGPPPPPTGPPTLDPNATSARPTTSSSPRPGTSYQNSFSQSQSHYHYQNEQQYQNYREQQYTADSEDMYTQEGEMIDLDSRGMSSAGHVQNYAQGYGHQQGQGYDQGQSMHLGGGNQIANNMHIMHDEEEEEDSDEDVFAFVPPTTAEQQAEREYLAQQQQQPQQQQQQQAFQYQQQYQQQQQQYQQYYTQQQAQQAYYQQQPYASFTAASTAMSAGGASIVSSAPLSEPSTSGSSPFGFSPPSPEPPSTSADEGVNQGGAALAPHVSMRPPPSRRGLGTSAGGSPAAAFGFPREAGAGAEVGQPGATSALRNNNPYAGMPTTSSGSTPSTGSPVTPVTPSFGFAHAQGPTITGAPATTNHAPPAFTSAYPTVPAVAQPSHRTNPPSPPSPSTDTDSHPGTGPGPASSAPPNGMFKLKRLNHPASNAQEAGKIEEAEDAEEDGKKDAHHSRPALALPIPGGAVSASSTLVAKEDERNAEAQADGEAESPKPSMTTASTKIEPMAPSPTTSKNSKRHNKTKRRSAGAEGVKAPMPMSPAPYDVDTEAQVLPYVGSGAGSTKKRTSTIPHPNAHARAHAADDYDAQDTVAGALVMSDAALGLGGASGAGIRRRNVNSQPYYAYAALANSTGYAYSGRAIGGHNGGIGVINMDAARGNTGISHRTGTAISSNADHSNGSGRITNAANAVRARAAQVLKHRRKNDKGAKIKKTARVNTATTDKGGDADVDADGDSTDMDDSGSLNKQVLADDDVTLDKKAVEHDVKDNKDRLSVASSSRRFAARPQTGTTTEDRPNLPRNSNGYYNETERGYTADSGNAWTAYSGNSTDNYNSQHARHRHPHAHRGETDAEYTEGEYDYEHDDGHGGRYGTRNSDAYDDDEYDEDGDGYDDDEDYEGAMQTGHGRAVGGAGHDDVRSIK